jgi:hypothetical protein
METDEQDASEDMPLMAPDKPVVILGPLDRVHSILSGEMAIKLHLEFLYRNNQSDLIILKNTKVVSF